MSHHNDLLAGINAHFDSFGQSATHTATDDTTTAVTAIISHDLDPYGPDVASVSVGSVAISVRRSDVATPPRKGETYKVGNTTYYVDSIIAADEIEYTALASD